MVAFLVGTAAVATPQGHLVSIAFGTPTIVMGAGFAVPVAKGSVPVVMPTGHPVPFGVGGGSIATAHGTAAAFGAGGAPVAIPQGHDAAFAFGTPTIELAISVTGFAVPFAFGDEPLAIPTGFAVGAAVSEAPIVAPTGFDGGAAVGSTPIVTPTGSAATFAAGDAPIASPAGHDAPFAVGDAPVVTPTGHDAPFTFGTPTVDVGVPPIDIAPSGFAAAFAVGDAPIAIPQSHDAAFAVGTPSIEGTQLATGFAAPFAFGDAPVVTPTGQAAAFAFGTPTVDVGVPPITITPTGFAAAAVFGEFPLVTPSGHIVTGIGRVTYMGAGERSAGNNAAVTPELPRRWAPGDLLIAGVLFSSPAGTVATPAGWSLDHTIGDANGDFYQYSRVAQAGDTAPTFTPSGGAAGDGLVGATIALRGARALGAYALTVNVAAEDIALTAPSADGVIDGAVVFLSARNGGFNVAQPLTGDNLTWVEAWDYSNGSQGTWMGADVGRWVGRATLTDKVKDLNIGNATSYGIAFVVTPESSEVSLAVPQGAATPFATGSVPIVAPPSHLSTADFGTATVAVPQGADAPAAFGTPTVAFDNAPIDISVAGFGCGTGFGDATVAVPTGAAFPFDVGGVPIASAFGTPANFNVGFAPIAAPLGHEARFDLGGAPAETPHGTGAAFDAGAAPTPTPGGFTASFAFGSPSIIIGGIGPVVIEEPSHAGLGLARKHLEALVEAWWKIQQEREQLQKSQERLTRQKVAAKRSRRIERPDEPDIVDLQVERRINDLIVACNRAYMALQERENEVYAGVRAHLVNTQAISAENRRALQAIEDAYQAQLQADDEEAMLVLM